MANRTTLLVPDISCGHCVMTVQNEVGELEGVQSVKADLDSKKVVVEWDEPATINAIKGRLVEIEYPAAEEINN